MANKAQGIKPEVRKKKRLSKIWIVPIVALLIGGGMVWDYFNDKGTIVKVSFLTAEGLVANKTKVKTRNVDIGVVTKVHFSKDRSRIIAEIEIDKEMNDFLRTDTLFWVVKPRVGVEGISGLGTLVSGSYIELSPGSSDSYENDFIGIEKPPVTPSNASGLRLVLVSKGGKPLSVGNPVIYRGFNVGKVEAFEFDAVNRKAIYDLFIESPYDALITDNTFFWNVGGLSVETTNTGLKVNMPSIDTFISGGVQFDVPDDLPLGEKVLDNEIFTLYPDESSIYEAREYDYIEYALLVEDSVDGLYAGAPVEYRGIRIGTVVTPFLTYEQSRKFKELDNDDRIPVIIKIEPERIVGSLSEESKDEFAEEFDQYIRRGMVASIESASLVFGNLKISLNFEGEAISDIAKVGPYPVIPTTSGGLGKITSKLNAVLTKFDQLALEKTVDGANKTLASLDSALLEFTKFLQEDSTQNIPENLNEVMAELQKTLQGFQPNSRIYGELEETLSELRDTLNSLQPLLKALDNKPNSLIFSGSEANDVEPKAKEK